MLAPVEITPWYWAGFIVIVLILLALDLGVFHRRAHVVSMKEALSWTAVWVALALIFAGAIAWLRDKHEATQFFTGYFIELSLSMDNVFVIAVVFSYFRVPPGLPASCAVLGRGRRAVDARADDLGGSPAHQPLRVAALLLRGVPAFQRGLKMMLKRDGNEDPEKGLVVMLQPERSCRSPANSTA